MGQLHETEHSVTEEVPSFRCGHVDLGGEGCCFGRHLNLLILAFWKQKMYIQLEAYRMCVRNLSRTHETHALDMCYVCELFLWLSVRYGLPLRQAQGVTYKGKTSSIMNLKGIQ